jgi:outer membrane receptor protein involved in Fe transport
MEPHDNDFAAYHLGLNGELGWATLQGSLTYIEHDIYSRYDATLAPPVTLPDGPGPAAFDALDNIRSVVTETTLLSPAYGRVQWAAGLFFAHTDQTSRTSLSELGPPAVLLYDELRHDSRDEGALYGEAMTAIGHGLTVTAGGRLFLSSDGVTSTNPTFALPKIRPPPPYSGAVGQLGFTPKIVLSETLSPSLLVYVQAAEGYRGPGINTASGPKESFSAPGGIEPLRIFKGDTLWSVEAGVKWTTLGGRLRLSATGFETWWSHVQSDQLLPSGIPFTANIGDARNLGLEFEGIYRAGALEIRAEGLINEPELFHANPYFASLEDTGLGVAPAQSFGLSIHDSWPLGHGVRVQADGAMAYTGRSALMLNIGKPPNMGDYFTAHIGIALTDHGWRVSLAVDNPANIGANTFGYGNPFITRFGKQSTPLRPRTLTLGVAASF